ncbi:MAG: Uma2 family endonuclease [Dehalococcoidia bacterium]
MPALPATYPLESGMRLSRAEFHALYLAHPEIKKAELIDGVVYVPSPVSKNHGPQHLQLATWLGAYIDNRPEVLGADNITTILPGDNEVQPDCCLWYQGGQAQYGDDDYLHGAPDFVAEVTATSRQYDLGVKKELYRRAGVREYFVWQTLPGRIDWWALENGDYVPLTPGADGLIESRAFPGLRLDAARLASGDTSRYLRDLANDPS